MQLLGLPGLAILQDDRAELAAAVVLRPELDDLAVEQDLHLRGHRDLVLQQLVGGQPVAPLHHRDPVDELREEQPPSSRPLLPPPSTTSWLAPL